MLVENYACEDELRKSLGGRKIKKNSFQLCLNEQILNEK